VDPVTEPTIDLGCATDHARYGARHRPTSQVRPRRRLPWRIGGVAMAALLLIAAPGADASPRPPALTHLGTVPAADQALLTEDTLYVHHYFRSRDAVLAAYRLSDDTMTWQVDEWEVGQNDVDGWQHAQEAPVAWLLVHNGVPLVTLRLFGVSAAPVMTTAYDPQTGAARWTREGEPAAGTADVMVLLRQETPPEPSDLWPRHRPVAVDLVTGEQVWTAPVGRWQYDFQRTDHARHLVHLDDNGRLTTYDINTGVSRSATTTVTGEIGYHVVGDLVLVHRPWDHVAQRPPDDTAVHAYDAETLTHQWTGDPGELSVMFGHCGSVMCMHGPAALHAVDPATGDVWWSTAAAPPFAEQAVSWPYSLGPEYPDTLLMDDHAIDAATGEPLLPLAPWGQEHDSVLRTSAWHLDPVLIRHPPREIGVESRTWFARLRSQPLGLEILGSTTRADQCRATNEHIVCRHHDQLHLWRIR
jgi:hypothetical protein